MNIAEAVERSERGIQEKGQSLREEITGDAMKLSNMMFATKLNIFSAQACERRCELAKTFAFVECH